MVAAPLVARDLVQVVGHRRILDGIDVVVPPGRRLGLVGENGVGKSTLLRLLAGESAPVAGMVERPDDVGYLAQELRFRPEQRVAEVVADAVRDAREDLAELDRLGEALAAVDPGSPEGEELAAQYGDRLERAQWHDAWDAARRAQLVLEGLGLGLLAHERRLDEISGGQRGRLALAALLVRRPAAVLLDEPTNHLDDAAIEFLETRLRELPGAVVLATHDRALRDAVCTDLLDLDPSPEGPVRFGGRYSDYVRVRRADRARWERRWAEQQEELAELREAAAVTARRVAPGRGPRDSEKMGQGHTAGRVQNQIAHRVRDAARRLEQLTREQLPAPPPILRLTSSAVTSDGLDGPLVTLREVEVAGRLRIDRLDVDADTHLLLTGPNGAGKSTMLGVLAGAVPATGSLVRRPGTTVGLLEQDTVFPAGHRTAERLYLDELGEELAAATPLDTLGLLAPRDAAISVEALSVGQRRRLALALMVSRPPHLLLLDEPTNHLSPTLVDDLEEAFGRAPGAIVVASHDRTLRRRWAGVHRRLEEGRLL